MKFKKLLVASSIATMAIASVPGVSMADDDQKIDMTGVVLNMQDAITIALGRVSGEVIEAELESEDDKVVWEISILGEKNEVSEVEIDANTGVVLEVEID